MSAPVRHTCPDIDNVINKIASAQKQADEGKSKAEWHSDEWYLFDSILDDLYRLDGTLENLRSDNSSLRDWGHDLEKEKEKLEDKIYELECEIEEQKQSA